MQLPWVEVGLHASICQFFQSVLDALVLITDAPKALAIRRLKQKINMGEHSNYAREKEDYRNSFAILQLRCQPVSLKVK